MDKDNIKVEWHRDNNNTLYIFCFVFVFFSFEALKFADLKNERLQKINLISQLEKENEKLEIEVVRLQAAQNLREKAISLGMTNVSEVSYLNIASEEVAINR